MLLSLREVSKDYGRSRGLATTNLEVDPGEIIGLLGPNGSGKTTLLRLAAGLLTPSSGEVRIELSAPRTQQHRFAFLSTSAVFPDWMTRTDVARFMSGLFPDFSSANFERLVTQLEIADRRFKALSRGNQTKLLLAATLARDVGLYLLDEPLAGIDFMTRESIIDAVLTEFRSGASVILSTHEIKDAEPLFDRILILREGEVLLDQRTEKIRAAGSSVVETYRSNMR
ncbi:MAG: ABC transporter ATP-binding protein [Deltaproteobacteria bacterium]|nr:ABC transporter ATP-binding protein [Deltaproteobacteria bacterium]